jgi:hypothetical protein
MTTLVSYRLSTDRLCKERPLEELLTHKIPDLMEFRRTWTTRKQTHTPGFFWFSTLNQHVYYESHLEKRTLLILDFHGKVQAILDQPFAIHFDGKAHVPDYLVQYANGQTSILDVKMKSRQSNEKVVQAFDATRKAAEELGWWYEIHCEQDAQYEINLDWLSGFRRPSAKVAQYRPSILQALMPDPLEFGELVKVVGDPLFSKPVIFNMLWNKELAMDMNGGLTERSLIRISSQALTS